MSFPRRRESSKQAIYFANWIPVPRFHEDKFHGNDSSQTVWEYKNIALPPIRFEVMWREIEHSDLEKCSEIAAGLERFFLEHPHSGMESIKIVVDDDPAVYIQLILEIQKRKSLKTILRNKKSGIAEPLKTFASNLKRSIFGK